MPNWEKRRATKWEKSPESGGWATLRLGSRRANIQAVGSGSLYDIAFEHISLYIQKHLGKSVAVCGILWKGRSWQTKAESGTARH